MADGNTRGFSCVERAIDLGDSEGEVLARILDQMSQTKRRKFPRRVYEYHRHADG